MLQFHDDDDSDPAGCISLVAAVVLFGACWGMVQLLVTVAWR